MAINEKQFLVKSNQVGLLFISKTSGPRPSPCIIRLTFRAIVTHTKYALDPASPAAPLYSSVCVHRKSKSSNNAGRTPSARSLHLLHLQQQIVFWSAPHANAKKRFWEGQLLVTFTALTTAFERGSSFPRPRSRSNWLLRNSFRRDSQWLKLVWVSFNFSKRTFYFLINNFRNSSSLLPILKLTVGVYYRNNTYDKPW